jgi:hypothetical protein
MRPSRAPTSRPALSSLCDWDGDHLVFANRGGPTDELDQPQGIERRMTTDIVVEVDVHIATLPLPPLHP